jgi:polyhydroxybutyrate depolymerase
MASRRRFGATLLALALAPLLAGCGGSASSATPPSAVEATVTVTATATAAALATPSPSPRAGLRITDGQIDVDGRTRDYRVVTPPDVADRGPLPLLLALHGWTQTMSDAERIGGFDMMAMDPGAVVVYPQGYGSSWNAGGCCKPANVEGIDDVGFIVALIDRMEADYPVDPERVFIVGGSNGGEMAERAACELSDRIAAIADVIGTLLVDCHPSQPVSVIGIHGSADVQIPILGGLTGDASCHEDPCPAFASVMQSWRQIDGCTGEPTVTGDASTIETTWTTCAGGTAVTFIKAIGKGHEWYTSNPDDRAVTWAFFMNHPRRAGTSDG